MGWLQLKLIHYLQNKNPSVPGIAEKIAPPEARNLDRVRKYWRMIIELDPSITDIYGNLPLIEEAISVDHFVPWQFVAHEELWNLHPITRNINSSKNNSLPVWDVYFEPLGELECCRKKKADERGAFEKRILLEKVIDDTDIHTFQA